VRASNKIVKIWTSPDSHNLTYINLFLLCGTASEIGGGGVGFSIGPVCRVDMNEHHHRRHGSRRTGVIGDIYGEVFDIPGVDIGGIRFNSWHHEI
jgi:hypothetical protein